MLLLHLPVPSKIGTSFDVSRQSLLFADSAARIPSRTAAQAVQLSGGGGRLMDVNTGWSFLHT
jgi:hypothetical protein